MNNRVTQILTSVLVMIIGVGLGAATAMATTATTAAADRKGELKDRFRDRLKEIDRLKADGVIGETWEGWVEALKGKDLTKKEQKLVDDENDDRRELYRIIAKEEGTTEEHVGKQNGTRNQRKLKAGEWFKTKDGDWEQRKRGARDQ